MVAATQVRITPLWQRHTAARHGAQHTAAHRPTANPRSLTHSPACSQLTEDEAVHAVQVLIRHCARIGDVRELDYLALLAEMHRLFGWHLLKAGEEDAGEGCVRNWITLQTYSAHATSSKQKKSQACGAYSWGAEWALESGVRLRRHPLLSPRQATPRPKYGGTLGRAVVPAQITRVREEQSEDVLPTSTLACTFPRLSLHSPQAVTRSAPTRYFAAST